MWIMLIKKLPTVVSPPKLSLFYSYKHRPTEDEINRCLKAYIWAEYGGLRVTAHLEDKELRDKYIAIIKDTDKIRDGLFGYVPNEFKAVWIYYKNEKIKVYPHEYSILTPENLKSYMIKSHELMSDNYATEQIQNTKLCKGQRFVYDAALVDGCDDFQAIMVALGKDPLDIPPPIGWWRCKPKYAQVYCYEDEMTG